LKGKEKMKRWLFLLLLVLLPIGVHAQTTTVARFDSPFCDGSGVGIYQGIDFSLSPWDCEKSASLPNDSTETISWYVNHTTGQFKFANSVGIAIVACWRLGGNKHTYDYY
jgi:hypothetical protein